MVRKLFHILLLSSLLCIPGCIIDLDQVWGGTDMELTIHCDDALTTKTTMDGNDDFNENLITSVDFLFYPGETPSPSESAIYHIRREPDETVLNQKTFDLVIKKNIIDQIFTQDNNYKATVYVLVNFEESFISSDLQGTSLSNLASRMIVTAFPETETNYKQPSFYMDGLEVLQYDENANPSVIKTINVTRLASKFTVDVHVESLVILHHETKLDQNNNPYTDPPEHWSPVLHTMRVYLVDGVKTTRLSHDGTTIPDPSAKDPSPSTDPSNSSFFAYKDRKTGIDASRPFVNNNNEAYVGSYESNGKVYYESAPMYTYPRVWTEGQPDYSGMDYPGYSPGLPPEPPYLKLELDWQRLEENNYSYDLRKYYYKIPMPFQKNAEGNYEFKRNNWYNIVIDLGILGSETDEGKVLVEPSCYILEWQNKSFIDKEAVISSARYLSVDRNWVLNNLESLTIPFLSSHNVVIVEGSIQARRPYYGEDQTPGLKDDLHAWVRGNETDGYYLDYVRQSTDTETRTYDATYNPVNWLTPLPTSIRFNHPLISDFVNRKDFDYSPYTIEFDIVHSDLVGKEQTQTYAQYKKHIVITQYPAIYIEATRNSDKDIDVINGNNGYIPAGYYPRDELPWPNRPWGYVYVNGGRFLRKYSAKYDIQDPYFDLKTDISKKEYQWQAVWYTGGSRDIFKINVTVLGDGSEFVIGDPRTDLVDNLGPTPTEPNRYSGLYDFSTTNTTDIGILQNNFSNATGLDVSRYTDGTRTGWAVALPAPSLKEGTTPRSLTNYYPTDKTSRTTNMLAPSYRISSKFGGTEFGYISKKHAEYRCAGYQEDGFPAGRWRLPTTAEIKFIAQLSAKKAFEHLFENGKPYWSAHGAVTPNSNGGVSVNYNATEALLRCVYDSWYWGDTQEGRAGTAEREVFYWGDRPKW